MKKTVPNDIALEVAYTRKAFFAAFNSVEEVQAEILKNNKRLEKVLCEVCERAGRYEKLRTSSMSIIVKYEEELERVGAEVEALRKAKDEKRNATQQHDAWAIRLHNARTRSQHELVRKLEAAEPVKPDDITIPEVRPVDARIEAKGLVAAYDLSVALNDYALAVAARSECKQREAELAELLDARQREWLKVREEYETDVNKTVAIHESRERAAKEQRSLKIKSLRAARDGAAAELSQMGAE